MLLLLVQQEGPQGPRGPGLGDLSPVSGIVVMVKGMGFMEVKTKGKSGPPITKMDHLVKTMKIKSLEEVFLFSLPNKESDIIEGFPGCIPKG